MGPDAERWPLWLSLRVALRGESVAGKQAVLPLGPGNQPPLLPMTYQDEQKRSQLHFPHYVESVIGSVVAFDGFQTAWPVVDVADDEVAAAAAGIDDYVVAVAAVVAVAVAHGAAVAAALGIATAVGIGGKGSCLLVDGSSSMVSEWEVAL